MPHLHDQIKARLKQAHDVLTELGEKPRDKADVRRSVQSYVGNRRDALECELTKNTTCLREKLLKHKDMLTFEFVSKRMHFKAFTPPFFQGREVFEACIRHIVFEWWAVDINSTVDACLDATRTHALVLDEFALTSPELARVYGSLWAAHESVFAEELRQRVADELKRAAKYGTLSHFLDAKFEVEALGFVPRMMDRFEVLATAVVTKAMQERHHSAQRLTQELVDGLSTFMEAEIGKSSAVDLENHQQQRVFGAVRAYFDVMFKQTVDNLLCHVRDCALDKWDFFVADTLASDQSLLEACVETPERVAKRAAAVDMRDRMKKCEEILRSL